MLRIGLTGGIGAGKTAVSTRLAALGAHVVDSDVIARRVVEPGSAGLAAVVGAFGSALLRPDGSLDREALGRLVFADPGARRRLETITHPLIAAATAAAVAAAQVEDPDGVVVHDLPLLVEVGLAAAFDAVVVVEAPTSVRLRRLAERGLPEEQALARMATQASDEQRRAVATYVVDNRGDLAALDGAVRRLWRELLVRAARG